MLFFSGIARARQQLRRAKVPDDPKAREALQMVRAHGHVEALGFGEQRLEKVAKLLKESGHDLDAQKLKAVTEYLDADERRQRASRRLLVQVSVSILVLAFSVIVLANGQPEASTQKALFGLIGTVLGYWLR